MVTRALRDTLFAHENLPAQEPALESGPSAIDSGNGQGQNIHINSPVASADMSSETYNVKPFGEHSGFQRKSSALGSSPIVPRPKAGSG
jgi:hypothetical protein